MASESTDKFALGWPGRNDLQLHFNHGTLSRAAFNLANAANVFQALFEIVQAIAGEFAGRLETASHGVSDPAMHAG